MTIISEPHILPPRSIAAAIGMFDGVHVGHKQVVSTLRYEAGLRGLKTGVITFAQHPQLVLNPNSDLCMIMPIDDRLKYLSELGLDYTILLNFDKSIAMLGAREFLQLVHNQYGVSLLVIGYNHRFGHNVEETFDDYVRYGAEIGVEIIKAEEYVGEYCPVSSSIIRRLISGGKVDDASHCLSRLFSIKGRVVHGFENGHKIGFPTANITPSCNAVIVPHRGVYAVRVKIEGCDKIFCGMANIGVRPTFNNGNSKSIEVHIFDFDEDIYGKDLTIEFVKFIRTERKMNSIDELQLQLMQDEKEARLILKNNI